MGRKQKKVPRYMLRESKKFNPDRIPINVDKLSSASRRSCCFPTHHKSKEVKCRRCGVRFEFSAEQQREWFEVRKRYLWSQPDKCAECFKRWLDLMHETQTYHERLREENSLKELRKMKINMEELSRLHYRHDHALYGRILKKIDLRKEQFRSVEQ